jgi:DNA-binding PadR family transcriptional regulator
VSVIRRSSDRSVLVLTGLSAGPKHGYALIKDVQTRRCHPGIGNPYGATTPQPDAARP